MGRNLRRQGKTILLTTHYMDEAQTLCDRLGSFWWRVLRRCWWWIGTISWIPGSD